ncbi:MULTISPECIES: GNAT family N-acetyltransferase [unclassified Lysinibacillus]|uniref:GNAT family N-acetyltransferase n=1 Tax=unclassified Lysinibacillus TaxID=2636778 RepID=UPI0020112FDB|nr:MULTISPECIES: GNAT family N-acetyltransferase [unclassified Lysinibacillus]MCL1694603.1 GNAT family N-acetyltransferase [Lysinibacillus sp. BPa_S21]MCL1699462.1 GNAT family N-acetyltransferase [Lysinibacillus sp. Bpr_S20]
MKYIESEKVTEEEKEHIIQELLKYNLDNIEDKIVKDIGLFVEDEQGKRVAGLIGDTHGNWLEVEYLWVSEKLRGQHIGTELMRKAEKIAINRGCKFAALNTFSFQAPDFYVKLGYKEEFVLNDYPLTGKRYYYTKKL